MKTEIWQAAKLLLVQLLKLDINEQLSLEVDYLKAENQVLKNQLAKSYDLAVRQGITRSSSGWLILTGLRTFTTGLLPALTGAFYEFLYGTGMTCPFDWIAQIHDLFPKLQKNIQHKFAESPVKTKFFSNHGDKTLPHFRTNEV